MSQSSSPSADSLACSRVYWVLRISAALCFIGHGAFGFITKESWIPFFSVVGISREWGYWFMPTVGAVDIAAGLAVLCFAWRPAMMYMAVWAVWTALLRPLSGLGWWEFFERAGNYGVPIALLYFATPKTSFIGTILVRRLDEQECRKLIVTLQLVSAFLVMGHAGFGIMMGKGLLFHHWRTVSNFPDQIGQESFVKLLGSFELILGGVLLSWARAEVAAFAFAWKVFSELLYPMSGDYVWEFIERAGSYGAPLALCILLSVPTFRANPPSWPLLLLSRFQFAFSGAPWKAHLSVVLLAWMIASIGVVAFVGPRPYATSDYVLSPRAIQLVAGEHLLTRLREGGNVLYFRHFHTTAAGVNDDLRQWETGRMPESAYDDCSWQRPLAEYGRARAAMVGSALKNLQVPVTRVISSPYCRCRETATLLTGVQPELISQLVFPRMEHTRERAERVVHEIFVASTQGNTVVVGHRPPMDQFGRIMEGEAYVFHTNKDGSYDLIAKVEANEWDEALVYPELLGLRWKSGYVQPHR